MKNKNKNKVKAIEEPSIKNVNHTDLKTFMNYKTNNMNIPFFKLRSG